MKNLIVLTVLFTIASFSTSKGDICISYTTHVALEPDSTQGIFIPITLTTPVTMWVDTLGRRAQQDMLDGTTRIIFADSGNISYERSDEFETYQRFGSLPDTTTFANDFMSGVAMLLPRPQLTLDTTGIEEMVNTFWCKKFVLTYISAHQHIVVELWVTNAYHLDAWIRDIYGVGPPPPAFDGIPVKIVSHEGKQHVSMEILSITEAPRPPNAYTVPSHYEYKP